MVKHVLLKLGIIFLVSLAYLNLSAQNYTLNFSGSDDCAVIASTFGLGASGSARTIECWVYIPSTSEKGTFVNIGTSNNGYGIGVGGASFDDNGNQLIFINNAVQWHPTGDNIGTGWHHVAYTVDASNNTTIWLDGYGVYSTTQTPHQPTSYAYIGSMEANFRFFSNGKIDEVRIWNVARTADEINANMYKEISTHTNLVGYYKMSDGSGTTLTDNSGNSNTGTISGATWQASGVFAGPRNALDFNGTDENVTVPHSSTLNLSNVTLTAWINADTWKNESYEGTIIVKEYGTNGYGLRCGKGGILSFFIFSGGRAYEITSAALMSTGKWHHVAGVYDGSTVKIYIDGICVGSAAAASPLATYTVELYIGGYGGRWFDGKIDECQLWSSALTESQIRENMLKTLTGNETGLQAYYRMDSFTGTVLYDVTSNANNGTLNNMETANWVSSSAFNTWIGGESSAWSSAGNWSRNAAPVSTDNTGLYKFTTGNEASISGTPTLNNMYFSSTASPTLSSNFTVNGNLILGKSIDLNGQQITIGTSGLLAEGNYRFYGTSGSITTTRTLSNITAENVGGFGAYITTAANMGSTTITRGHAAQSGNGNTGILRYYDIQPAINTDLNATLDFKYDDNELNGKTESNLLLFKLINGGTSWTNQGGTVNTSNNTVTLAGIDGFSRWTAGDKDTPISNEELLPNGGYALKFTNGSDNVAVGTFSGISTTQTAECWVYVPSTSEKGPFVTINYFEDIASIGVGGTDLWNPGNQLILYYNGVSKTTGANLGTGWHHTAFSIDASGNVAIYLDGKSVYTYTTFPPSENSSALLMGKLSAGQSFYLSNGKIDEVRIWNTVRSESEIKSNMYKEINTNWNLKGYYKMSDSTGTKLTDNSGNGNSGTINGAAWIASGCFAGPRNALDFGGIDDYVNIPASTTLNNAKFTVEFWVNLTQITGTFNGIIDKGREPGSGTDWYFLTYTGAAPQGVGIFGYQGWETYYELGFKKWNHVAGVYDGTNFTLYLNGKLISTVAKSYTPTTNNISIGSKRGASNPFYGKLDEVRIWSTARSAVEIRENLAKTLTGYETGLEAYYRFDNTDGTTLYDLTSNANNGTLTNMDPATDWVTSSAFNTWIGSESNVWNTAGNWSRNSFPTTTDNVGLYKFTNLSNDANLTGTPAVNLLLFSTTGSPTLSSDFTVNGNLLLNKDIDLSGRIITLGSNGYLVEGDYRLYGPSGTITTTRNLSNLSAENVGGLGAIITTAVNMGSTTITRGHASQIGGGNSSILRYYDISPTNNSGLNATLSFKYNINELNSLTENNLRLFQSTDGGNEWFIQGGTLNPTGKTVTLSGINKFSRWTLADIDSPLPVQINSFSASVNGNNVTLVWKTSSEFNNSGFDIERKVDGSEWEKVDFVKGSGTTNTTRDYSFTDKKLSKGRYHYRLKQIDLNGNFEYHNLNNAMEVGIPSKFEMSQNYPNPFNPATKIDFSLSIDTKVTLSVFDITGREIVRLIDNEYRKADYYTVQLNGTGYSSGVYFYRIQTEQDNQTKRMLFIK